MSAFNLFEVYGIEIEYMIVDAVSFDVRPISDRILVGDGSGPEVELEMGKLAWSNELVLHVIELKTAEPTRELAPVADWFQKDVRAVNRQLNQHGARLLPGAMHPWMDPTFETRLWPHGQNEIYAAYDRIFDCSGHGWSNLQSMHLNLPFGDDEQFGRLHAAIRAVLPLLPALSASSPYADGKRQAFTNYRMEVYRHNSDRVPLVTGGVVPESVSTKEEYEQRILEPMYRSIAPHDPEKILQHEWLNARGAIARFDRNSIEIRVLDTQECPRADLAIAAGVVSLLRALVDTNLTDCERLARLPEKSLTSLLEKTVRDAELARVADPEYLAALGLPTSEASAQEVWSSIVEAHPPAEVGLLSTLRQIVSSGPLARRMLRRAGNEPKRPELLDLARDLAECLDDGRLLEA